MSLAYKIDSVIGEIVNKTRLSNKKLARSNQNSKNTKYLYMTRESGEKIKDFIDLDNKRQEQIIQDAQVLKKAYLSDEVVEKITSEIDKIFEKEYYSYTNRLHEHKEVLEHYRTYLDGIEDSYVPYVIFGLEDAQSGTFAPVAQSAKNIIRIFANEQISKDITIPTIQCIRKA